MPDTSHILSLPLIQPAQAQKHVTHNEALRILDAVVQLVVRASDQSVPPQAVQSGDRYIVAAQGTGAWSGHDGEIAVYEDTYWSFITPLPGWRAEVLAPQGTLIFDATAGWQTANATLETVPQFGINTDADTVNRLSVSSQATLLNHEGSGHQLKLNKAGADDTASLLYQTAFSGRVEMGLAGNDDFAIKVSADGTTWREALQIDAPTARVIAPEGIESLQVSVPAGTVLAIKAPSAAGFAFISSVSPDFPQGQASMVLCYDVGPSPQLFMVWNGSAVNNLGSTLPTGTSGPSGQVSVAVQSDGMIYLENQYPNSTDLDYCVSWINGWR